MRGRGWRWARCAASGACPRAGACPPAGRAASGAGGVSACGGVSGAGRGVRRRGRVRLWGACLGLGAVCGARRRKLSEPLGALGSAVHVWRAPVRQRARRRWGLRVGCGRGLGPTRDGGLGAGPWRAGASWWALPGPRTDWLKEPCPFSGTAGPALDSVPRVLWQRLCPAWSSSPISAP